MHTHGRRERDVRNIGRKTFRMNHGSADSCDPEECAVNGGIAMSNWKLR